LERIIECNASSLTRKDDAVKRITVVSALLVVLFHLGCAGGGGQGVSTGAGEGTNVITDEQGFTREMSDAEVEYQTAQQFLASGNLREAVDHLQRAADLKPTYLEAWSDLGKTLTTLKEYDAAITALERALALSPRNEGLIGYLGRNYLFLENWDQAARYYRMLVEENPEDYNGNVNLGFIYQKKGKTDSAIVFYERAVAANPGDATTMGSLATLYGDEGNREKKLEYLSKAIEAAPDNYRFKTQLGTEYFNNKEYDKAVPIYEALVAQFPDMAAYYQRLGFALSQTDRKAEAPAVLEKSIELKGNDPFIFAILARIYNEDGQYQKAIEKSKAGLALNAGQEAFLYYQWGEALSKIKQYDEAIEKFQKVVSYNDPTWTNPAHQQIDRQLTLKKREEAIKERDRYE
jgi:protein O-GlcNAc transferase